MKRLFFVRHGQTVWNVENKICGAVDSPLTERGIQQAEEVARKILEEKIEFDEILCSPLSRAKDTAKVISDATGIALREEPRLFEQRFGMYESTPRDGEEFRRAKASFCNSYGDGESMLRLCQRIYNLLDEIKLSDRTFLLVAHNGISRAVNSYFHDMTNEEYAAFGIKNCEIRKYVFE